MTAVKLVQIMSTSSTVIVYDIWVSRGSGGISQENVLERQASNEW